MVRIIAALVALLTPALFTRADTFAPVPKPLRVAQAQDSKFEQTEAPEVTLEKPETLERTGDNPVGPPPPEAQPPESEPPAPDWWKGPQESIGEAIDAQSGDDEGGLLEGGMEGHTGDDSLGYAILQGFNSPQGFIALLIVLALITLCTFVVNRLGRKTPLLAGANLGTVLGKIYLSPKASLHFIRVGHTVLVVGLSPAGMTTIAQLDAALVQRFKEPAADPRKAPPKNRFVDHLKARALPDLARGLEREEDEIAALKGDLARLQQYLQETSRELGD